MSAVRLYLLRHGEAAGADVFYGATDLPLTAVGVAQAKAQARALAAIDVDAIYSSDLQRAWNGAELLAAARREAGAAPAGLIAAPALRELCLGVLEGVPHRQLAIRFPALAGLRFADLLDHRLDGGGENIRDLAARVLPWLEATIRRHASEGRPVTLAIVSHQFVLRVILAAAAGLGAAGYLRFPQDLGAISRIDLPTAPAPDAEVFAQAILTRTNWRPALTTP